MRTLGPGSVSSFLKIVLDVVYAALWAAAVVLAPLALAAGLFAADPDLFSTFIHIPELDAQLAERGGSVVFGLLAAGLYVAGVLVIVNRLRRVFGTLTAGDPFHPDNVRRLRMVGLMLAALELSRYLVAMARPWVAPHATRHSTGVSLTAWFAVLVVFVLAEVFREGARLRREAELTI